MYSNEFEDQKWDPYNDICAVKTFQRTNNAVKKDNDKFLGYDKKTSTRFDRNFSISDFLRINVGVEVGLPLVSKLKLVAVAIILVVEEVFLSSFGNVCIYVLYGCSAGLCCAQDLVSS